MIIFQNHVDRHEVKIHRQNRQVTFKYCCMQLGENLADVNQMEIDFSLKHFYSTLQQTNAK